MFYRPTKVAKMWDTWLYYHDGVHYLYYLHETTGARFDGMSVATCHQHPRGGLPKAEKRG